jgi:hypothetical protein
VYRYEQGEPAQPVAQPSAQPVTAAPFVTEPAPDRTVPAPDRLVGMSTPPDPMVGRGALGRLLVRRGHSISPRHERIAVGTATAVGLLLAFLLGLTVGGLDPATGPDCVPAATPGTQSVGMAAR